MTTRWPTRTPVTRVPVRWTTPQNSWPGEYGYEPPAVPSQAATIGQHAVFLTLLIGGYLAALGLRAWR